jgi:hypothetical protein
MKNLKLPLMIVVLALIAGTAGALTWLPAHQRLGKPGIKGVPTATNAVVMQLELPAQVLDYVSTNLPPSEDVVRYLPPDTSYANRIYVAPDNFGVKADIILMGADRTSIHKPDFCVPAQGWQIVKKETSNLTIGGPEPYEMPVARWTLRRTAQLPDGTKQEQAGVFVYWLVADNEQAVRHNDFIKMETWDLLRTGVLQRWAYVIYMSGCYPGQEDAAFERMKRLISASVPEFQFPPRSSKHPAIARQ